MNVPLLTPHHQLTFHIKNPRHVTGGASIIPFPENHTSSPDIFSKGPEPDTAYLLWRKNDIKEKNDDSEINPTISSHKGWTMVAKCIFRGWKVLEDDWCEPDMSTLIKMDSTISDHDLNEEIKFRRQYRFSRGMRRSTNRMVNIFYWKKIIKPTEHSDLFYKEGVKNRTILGNRLTKSPNNNILEQNMKPDPMTLMTGYLGGRKTQRKKRKKRRKKRKTKKRKTKRKTKRKKKKTKKTFRNQRGCKR